MYFGSEAPSLLNKARERALFAHQHPLLPPMPRQILLLLVVIEAQVLAPRLRREHAVRVRDAVAFSAEAVLIASSDLAC